MNAVQAWILFFTSFSWSQHFIQLNIRLKGSESLMGWILSLCFSSYWEMLLCIYVCMHKSNLLTELSSSLTANRMNWSQWIAAWLVSAQNNKDYWWTAGWNNSLTGIIHLKQADPKANKCYPIISPCSWFVLGENVIVWSMNGTN